MVNKPLLRPAISGGGVRGPWGGGLTSHKRGGFTKMDFQSPFWEDHVEFSSKNQAVKW